MPKFQDLFEFKKKSKIKAGEGLKSGKYPFFTSSEHQSKYLDKYLFDSSSLIFGTGGNASLHCSQSPFAVSTDCLVAQPKDKRKVKPKFYYYFLKNNIHLLERGFRGAGLKHISKKYISDINLPQFSLGKQEKIISILDKANSLRKKRQESIKLLDEFFRSKFLDIFGDPIFEGLKTNSACLGDYFTVRHGYAFKSEYFTNKGDYVLLTPGNFYEKGGYRDRGGKQKFYGGEIPKEYILRKGNILVAMTEQAPGLLGSPIIVPDSNKYLHNQRLGLLVFKNSKVNREFVFNMFNLKTIRKLIHEQATGTKVKHTSPGKIERIPICMPKINLQNKFALIFKKVEEVKKKMKNSSEEINDHFNALMQRYFG